MITSRTPTAKKKLGSIRAGGSSPHIREIYTLKRMFTSLFLVLPLAYRRDRWTDFDAQYVIQRGSAQGSALWGLENLKLIFNLFIPKIQKNTMAPIGKILQTVITSVVYNIES